MVNQQIRLYDLSYLHQVLGQFLEGASSNQIMDQVLHDCIERLAADAITLVLWNGDLGVFNYEIGIPSELAILGRILNLKDGGLDAKVHQERTIQHLVYYSKNMYVYLPLQSANFQFAIGIPIISKSKVIATIGIYFTSRTEKISSDEAILLSMIGDNIRIILDYIILKDNADIAQFNYAQTSRFLTTLIDNSPLVIIYTDIMGIIKFWNKTAESIFGQMSAEIIGKKIFSVANLVFEPFLKFFPLLQQGNAFLDEQFSYNSLGSNAKEIVFQMSLVPIKDQNETVDSVLISGKDITEKQHLEKEMSEISFELSKKKEELDHIATRFSILEREYIVKEKMAMVGQISQRLAHNINNPLMTIYSSIELLQDDLINGDLQSDAKKADLIKVAEDLKIESQRIRAVLKSLTKFSEIAQEVHFRKENLHQLINQIVKSFKNRFVDSSITFIKQAPEKKAEFWEIEGNFQQLINVFSEIIDNAIIAVNLLPEDQKNRHIMLKMDTETELAKEYFIISIEDTGIGVKQEYKTHLFSPYTTYWPKKEQERMMHSGMGLALSRLILHNHNAHIELKDINEGGTKVIIKIPKPLSELK
jgi:PAS domain S-box-containing protein